MNVEIVTAIISSSVAATIGIMSWLNGRANLRAQRIAERRKSIAKMLNEFYGPLISYLNITYSLNEVLKRDKPKGFRTLLYLIDPHQEYEVDGKKTKVALSHLDKVVLEEIIRVEEQIETLIVQKSGLVDDSRLMFERLISRDNNFGSNSLTSLGTLIAHFHLLKLAYEGRFEDENDMTENYKIFVFPRDLERVVYENYNALHEELRYLGRKKWLPWN